MGNAALKLRYKDERCLPVGACILANDGWEFWSNWHVKNMNKCEGSITTPRLKLIMKY